MKKLNKLVISLALVIILSMPVFVGGCFGFFDEEITLHTEFKTTYEIGEELDVTNGKIEYTDENGKKSVVVITPDMVDGFDNTTAGTREMVITYEGNTTLVEYTILPDDVELNTIYYQTPCMIAQNFTYGYLKFVSATEAYFVASSSKLTDLDPSMFQNDDYKLQLTKTIDDNKVVYTGEYAVGPGFTVDLTFTVLSKTQIKFEAYSQADQLSIDSTLTKYVESNEPVDVELDVVYYCQLTSDPEPRYMYQKFDSATKAYWATTNLELAEALHEGLLANESFTYTLTRSIVNNKVVYTCKDFVMGPGYVYDYTFTILSNTEIKVDIYSQADDTNMEITLTKYVYV